MVGATAAAAWSCWEVACSRLLATFCVGDILRVVAAERVLSEVRVRRAVSAGIWRRAALEKDMTTICVCSKGEKK